MDGTAIKRSRAHSDGCSQLQVNLFLNECLYSTVYAYYDERFVFAYKAEKWWVKSVHWMEQESG